MAAGANSLDLMQRLVLLFGAVGLVLSAACASDTRPVNGVPAQRLSFDSGALIPAGFLRTAHARADSFIYAWYSRELVSLGEPRLIDAAAHDDDEAYRFLWIRSFDPVVAVRVQLLHDGRPIAIVSQTAHSAAFELSPRTRRDTIPLSASDWQGLRTTLEREHFWTMPPTNPEPGGLDGAQWVIEGLRGGRYHIADRWTPSDTGTGAPMRRTGLRFIRLGRVNAAPERIY